MIDIDESDSCDEIDLETSTVPVVAVWPPQIGNGSSLLIPTPLRNSSRTNSISSQITDQEETSFHVR